ncbi:hypothetical protein [Solidesulfovibrio sp.]
MELFTIGDKAVSISPEAIEAGKAALTGIADVMLVVSAIMAAGLAVVFGFFWVVGKRRERAYFKMLLKRQEGTRP